MKISAPWLALPALQKLCAVLTEGGHQAWFVGGAVRNALIGGGTTDIDLTTDALPQRVQALMQSAGFKTVPTGIEHGTLTVLTEEGPVEVTTFRRDVETDGRRAVVAFSQHIEEDAARRDFTMNALYAAPDGTLCDPLGGLSDAKAHVVRFIGDPEQRIREDYLRILRFFRFFAWYGEAGNIEAEGLAACAALADGIETLSRERVGAEMQKLLAAPDPSAAVAAMARSGVLMRVLPGAGPAALAVLVHLEAEYGLAPSMLCRLAALGGEEVASALKLSNAQAKALKAYHSAAELTPLEAGYRHGAEIALGGVLLRWASFGQMPPAAELEAAARGAAAVFPLVAADLMPKYQGPALGAALKAAEARWIGSAMSLSRDELLA